MTFKKDGNSYIIGIDTKYPDSTHSLHGELVFHSTNSNIDVVDYGEGNHCWRLIAPQCTVEGNFALSQYDDIHSEWIFNGHGYHDCNSGTDALDADYDDWYWGRCDIGNNQTIIYYHYPSSPNTQELSIGFIADSAHGIRKIEQCSIKLEDITITSSLMRIASSIIIQGFISGKSLNIRINHIHTLEFGPFYYRFMIKTESDMLPQHNLGIAEYFNAKRLKSRLVRTMIKTPMQRV
jgi:hypothetical protein